VLLGGLTAPVSGVAVGGLVAGAPVVAPLAGAAVSGVVAAVFAVFPVLAAAAISIDRRSLRDARR
jgi:hypothetical protein